ncbi:MAG: M12 family metallo-peptidase, partial [Bacteroidota bacterium]
MRTYLTLLLSCIISLTLAQVNAQSIKPADLVQSKKDVAASFTEVTPFTAAVQKNSLVNELDASVVDFDVLNISSQTLEAFSKYNAPETMTFQIPFETKNTTLELELVKVNIFTSDFQVTLGSTGEAADVELGTHYRGIIKNDPHSVAAISIFDEEVMGLIANDEGNLVLGKLEGASWSGEHVLYDDRTILADHSLDCGTNDDGIGYKATDLEFNYEEKAVGDCIRLYMEADNDIHNQKGGVQNTANYINGLMNEVITLYANESIASVVSELKVWDTPSPYSSNSSSGMLSDFQVATGSFNGDLAQLLSYQASGGIAAGFSGICNANPDNSKAFSNITSTYSSVPTYSWSVMVTTHEFGHLWGSRHTHACVWNGNNTAIDGCAGQTEGFCSLPGFPSSGGTIMSYCHIQSVGINFNNGFGPQPGNVIRNSVANANCTAPCGPASCTDGIQNGNETGVDCGGPDCPACPTCNDGVQNGNETGVDCGGDCAPCPCTGENVTLTIVLDNYPEETSWTITAGGTTFASGGTYGSQPDGSTVVEVSCLSNGCYDFNIFDSYGDGICCSYGNGSYTLADEGGNTLASGGAFGSSETTNFCVSGGGGDTTPPSNPTSLSASNTTQTTTDLSWNASTDNVGVTGYNVYLNGSSIGQVASTAANVTGLAPSTTYSFYVTAVDDAGNESGQSNTVNVTTLSNGGGGCTAATYGPYSFESSLEGWVDGGSDCARGQSGTYSYDGNYSIRIRDNSSSSYTNSPSLDLAEFSSVDIEFYFKPRGMENGEDFWVRYNDGTGWQTVATYVVDGSNIVNNSFY